MLDTVLHFHYIDFLHAFFVIQWTNFKSFFNVVTREFLVAVATLEMVLWVSWLVGKNDFEKYHHKT